MIIDFHTHTFPEKVSGNIIDQLSKTARIKAYTDGSNRALQASMEEDLLHELLKAMSGYEIDQIVEEEIFRGRRTCIFYKGRV